MREITDIKLLGKGFTVNICFATEATALKGIIWIASNITGGVRTASGSEKDDRENITHAIKLKRFFKSLLFLSSKSRNLWWMTLKHKANLVWKVSHHSGSFKRHIINSVDLNANSTGNKKDFLLQFHSPPETIRDFCCCNRRSDKNQVGCEKCYLTLSAMSPWRIQFNLSAQNDANCENSHSDNIFLTQIMQEDSFC